MILLKKFISTILTWEARALLARTKPRIVAVTGSMGKTTTKDAVYAVLAGVAHVRKSEKSFNTELGVPLTILGLPNGWRNPFVWMANIVRGAAYALMPGRYPQWLVLEVGADRPGDIQSLTRWLRPDIVVLTGVPEIPPHIEFFSSHEELLKEKRALALALKPGGTLILNGDDPHMQEMHAEFRAVSTTYGMESHNDFSGSHDEIIYENGAPSGMRFRMNNDGSSVPVALYGALGRPRIYAALAALAVGKTAGLDFVSLARALGEWVPPPGRLRILKGLKESIVIDDTYNSSPAAALAALDTLKEVEGMKRKIAVLGDMLELGKHSAEAHRKVGERAAACADMLITVGFRARVMGEAALDAGMPEGNIREYELDESARAGKELELELREGDLVLVKGSQGMRMERTVHEIMAEPERVEELLVRQDEEWQNR